VSALSAGGAFIWTRIEGLAPPEQFILALLALVSVLSMFALVLHLNRTAPSSVRHALDMHGKIWTNPKGRKHARLLVTVGVLILAFVMGLSSIRRRSNLNRARPHGVPLALQEEIKKLNEQLREARFKEREALVKLLQSPEYINIQVMYRDLRAKVEDAETKADCSLDCISLKCYPTPPAIISRPQFTIAVPASFVADELTRSPIWLMQGSYCSQVPILIYLRLTNTGTSPDQIDYIAIESLSINKWRAIRRVGTLDASDGKGDIIMEQKDGHGLGWFLKGPNLAPRLKELTIPPSGSLERWVLIEYPPLVAHGDAVGDLRISLHSATGRWVGRTTLHTPRSIEPGLCTDSAFQARVPLG